MAFFSKFPTVTYSINGDQQVELITNILFRTKLFSYIRNNTTSYYNYTLREGDTPEIVAEKYYGTADAYWLVLYANDCVDPQFDWMLNSDAFNKYLVSKYGSVANAMSTIHHYQKVITTIDSVTGLQSVKTYDVDLTDPRIVVGDSSIPYDTYSNMPDFFDVNPQGKFVDGSGVEMFITRNEINCYDYEYDLNESKRDIRLIRKEYWPQIQTEFQNITNKASPQNTYLRQIKSV